ncbi:MAG: hypothetical protein LC799_23550 [Actinobacteria bacterium]|nr:hypothetical protein [Actinomycetota bacterium]
MRGAAARESGHCQSWPSVQLTLSRFRSALGAAVHRRLIEHNPAAPGEVPDAGQDGTGTVDGRRGQDVPGVAGR